jgi:hypothetical protein
MFLNLLNEAKIIKINNSNAAATTNFNTATVAMAGFNSCLFLLDLGVVTAGGVIGLNALGGNQANGSDATQMVSTNGTNIGVSVTDVAAAANNQVMLLDVHHSNNYACLSAQVTRQTQTVAVNKVYAILYNSVTRPIAAQDANVAGSATWESK